MLLDSFFNTIESLEFQVEYAVLGGFRPVRMALYRDQTLTELVQLLKFNIQGVDDVVARVFSVLKQGEDVPGATYDIAVTAYLHCLFEVDPAAAARVGSYVLHDGGLWWAVDMALRAKAFMDSFHSELKSQVLAFTQTNVNTICLDADNMHVTRKVKKLREAPKWNTCGQSSVNLSYTTTPVTQLA